MSRSFLAPLLAPALAVMALFVVPARAAEPVPAGAVPPTPERTSGADSGQPAATKAGPNTGEPAEEAKKTWTFGGDADFYFSYNANHPYNGRNQLRTYDSKDQHGPHLGELDLWVQRERTPVGFRLEGVLGPNAAIEAGADPSRSDVWQHLRQAYVSGNLNPEGTRYVTFGKWSTPVGFEAIQPTERWLYSTGLLYSWSVPTYHFGLQFYNYFNKTDYLLVHVNRGWDSVGDPGHGPGFGFTYNRTLTSQWAGTVSYLGGEENDLFNRAGWRNLVDLVATYTPSKQWSYAANVDYGGQQDVKLGAATPRAVNWYGASLFAKYSLTEGQYLSARADWFRDDSGFRLGDKEDAYSLSLGYGRTLAPHAQARLEYRHDFAGGGKPFLGSRPGRSFSTQDTVLAALVLSLQ